jgi:hypothetical protein
MYKRRLGIWGFQKHVQRRNALAMVRIARIRAANRGKDTSFKTQNSATDLINIERYLKRKYRSNAEIVKALGEAPSTPEGLEYATPPSVPQSPRLSTISALPLELLSCLRDYFQSSFDGGFWVKQSDDMDCYSTRPHGGDMKGLKALFSYHDLACQLLDRGRSHEAGQILRDAFASIQELITGQHPRTLTAIFDLTTHLIRRKRPEVASVMLKQFSRLASIVLGESHPVGKVCDRLVTYRSFDFHSCLIMAWRNAIDQFENHLGALHYSTIRCRLEYIQMAVGIDDLTLAEQQIRQLVLLCEGELGSEDLRTLKLLDTLAEVLFDLGRWQECAVIGQKIVRVAPIVVLEDYDRYIDLTCTGLCNVARSQHAQGFKYEAASTLWEAIDLCIFHRGLKHPLSIKYLVTLEDWAHQWEDSDLMTKVQNRRAATLGGLL